MTLKAPFPYFGGKSRVAHLVWARFGDVSNYVEPFAGSLAVLLARPHEPRIETVNDRDCVAPETRILRSNLRWAQAGEVQVGDELVGFDESNGPARAGLRAPTRYRRLTKTTVEGVTRLIKPCYRLTFEDGTSVVASENHMWLSGSHRTGGRGWRWLKTKNLVANRKDQRSACLKVFDVVDREETHEAGWLGGIIDGEGHLKIAPGANISIAQNAGDISTRIEQLLTDRGFEVRRDALRHCNKLHINGGIRATVNALMRFRPERLIAKLVDNLHAMSLYGREHRAVGLIGKEYLGEREVVAIQTGSKTFIAEGLASHNCFLSNFWRALQHDPEGVARHADWPVSEADLHSRHRWLVGQHYFRELMLRDPDFYDAKIAGWWVWGISQWIGSGWCTEPGWTGRFAAASPRGIHASALTRKLPLVGGTHGTGVHKKLPAMDRSANRGVGRTENIIEWMRALSDRLRKVRVCCGDWSRIVGPSPTFHIGLTGVFLDPPYDPAELARTNGAGGDKKGNVIYGHHDAAISADVRNWAIENGDNPKLRIALCGYEGEHDMEKSLKKGWSVVEWKASGGYAKSAKGRANSKRERIWFSPHCLQPPSLFSQVEDEPLEETA